MATVGRTILLKLLKHPLRRCFVGVRVVYVCVTVCKPRQKVAINYPAILLLILWPGL